MSNACLITKVKSSYILNNIINYIPDKDWQEKLFLYSKKLQKKLNIHLIGLKEKYLKKIGFDLDKYLYIHPDFYEKDCLAKEYHNFLKQSNINIKSLEKIIYELYENKIFKDIEEEKLDKIKNYGKLINIDSPLFNIISKTKNFEKIFTIHISQKNIDEYNLKDYYIKTFNDLNNLKIKYTSILLILNNIIKIRYLQDFNIDFNKIKRLTLNIEKDENNPFDNIKKKENFFFKTLFSFKNIENNLVYLNIKFVNYNISSKLLKNINNFKLLKYLYINSFHLKRSLSIKLNTLKLLSINNCNNKIIQEISTEKVQLLNLSSNKLMNVDILEEVNFKELKILNLSFNNLYNVNILEKANFKELRELNLSSNKLFNIDVLEKVNFEKLKLLNLSSNRLMNIDVLEKVNFKELKELNLSCNNLHNIDILGKVSFEKLKMLNLSSNKIWSINILDKVMFKKLKELNLSSNRINNIYVLEKVNFKELKELNLSSNDISDINALQKANFGELEILDLCSNKIKDIIIF